MIRRVTIRNFKRFPEVTFELADSVVLAGPNNAGKSTLLQAIATWRLVLDRWVAQRGSGRAHRRPGVTLPRTELTSVPLREVNLLWEGRKVTGSRGVAGSPRLIEILVEGGTGKDEWSCGIELQYTNPELVYARPLNSKNLDRESVHQFPPKVAKDLGVVHVPPLAGIERDEPRRDRGMQDVLTGQGRPGEILRNLLWEIADSGDPEEWSALADHMRDLFRIELARPKYSPARPYIICEYRDSKDTRPLDLSNAGSGTLQVLLLLAFLYARQATVILLDEPDSHQHVILQRQVYDMLRKVADDRRGQIIIATHSEILLDATPPDRVLGFFGSSPRPLASATERNRLREALKRISTTELLLGRETGAVLYVERESDGRILGEWARILEHRAVRFFERPFLHVLEGRSPKEARDHYFAMKAAVSDLRALCLLDGDNRDEPDDELIGTDLVVLRWRRYEIENYLLQPEAIKRFVSFPLAEHSVDEEFYRQVPKGTDLFGDHVALSRLKASEEFLVPLLESVGKPTRKRDLHFLASRMKATELHPEIVEKLDRIADCLLPA